jgi:hypothetical protein
MVYPQTSCPFTAQKMSGCLGWSLFMQSLMGKGSKVPFPLDVNGEARMGRSVLMSHLGNERVGEGSTTPAKHTGVGS